MSLKQLILVLGSVAFMAGCTQSEVGTKGRPFTMYFVPSVDAQKITTGADDLEKYVAKYVSQKLYKKDDGFYVKTAVPSSYIAVVEAFGTKKADLAAVTTFSYILAKDIKKYPVEAILTFTRHGDKTFRGQFITRTDSGINSLEDLKDKKFAFVDPSSTSGYFLPKMLLQEKQIPLGATVFAQKHDNVVTMVYQKQVDAGATFYSPPIETEVNGKKVTEIRDARMRVLSQFPDIEKKVKIIGFTGEIPNEPWVMRTNLLKDAGKSEELKKIIIEALIEYSKTESGKKALKDMYEQDEFVLANDEDYSKIRKVIVDSGLKLEDTMKK
jgi:phosphonate transport system substrate-binding protein